MAAEPGPEAATVDLLAVQTLLAAALVHDGPRAFVYTSGCWVLGETGDRPADESSPTDHPAPAVHWRPAHERQVLAARGDRLVTAVVRPGMVFGRKGGLFERFFAEARGGRPVTVVGDGRNRWSTVHLDDVAALYTAVLEDAHTTVRALAPRDRIFHAMSGSSERVADIAAAASRAAGGQGVRLQPVAEARESLGRWRTPWPWTRWCGRSAPSASSASGPVCPASSPTPPRLSESTRPLEAPHPPPGLLPLDPGPRGAVGDPVRAAELDLP
jgi:nucleoside-diphosphate-sugar epimerase